MLGFLIGVSLAIFVIGVYLIIKSAKEKKERKKDKNEEVEEVPFTSFDDKNEE